MTRIFHGKAHGKTIELTEDLGLRDGEDIEIQINATTNSVRTGEGLLRTEGALADDQEWDQIMQEIYRDRCC